MKHKEVDILPEVFRKKKRQNNKGKLQKSRLRKKHKAIISSLKSNNSNSAHSCTIFRKVQKLSWNGRNLCSNPQIAISLRYNLRKRSPATKIERNNQQEVINTVLIQGDQIPI